MKNETKSQSGGLQDGPAVKRGGASMKSKRSKGANVSPKFVGSLVALADELGVTRQTLTRWHREPGCPGRRADGRHEVAPWRKFMQSRSRFGGGPCGYAAKCENIRLHCEKLAFEIDQLQRRYIPVKAVEAMSADLVDKVRAVVRGAIVRVAPELTTATVPVAEAKLKAVGDTILHQLHTIGTR